MQRNHAFSIVMWILFLYITVVNAVEAEGTLATLVGEHDTYSGYNYEDRLGELIGNAAHVKRIITVPDDFAAIQTAINNANNGDTIQVKPKIYFEYIVVNKTISLIGEERDTTIIDGNGIGTVMRVTADNVIISGFTVRNGAFGILLDSSRNTTVTDNNVNNNNDGIHLFSSQICSINKNNASNNHHRGIFLNNSWNCTISRNIVNYNSWYGINLNSSRNCIVDRNEAENNYWDGIGLYSSENCVIHGNNVKNNTLSGIWLDSSNNNIIYHNNFFHNYFQASSVASSNIWDNNREGNYWSDYNGEDSLSGPYQNLTDGDGIGDIPYSIDVNNTDNYPLMGQFSSFDILWQKKTCYVTTVSNYTISNFHFTSGQISFYITSSNETIGFCRVSIPIALLNGPYNVTLNGVKPLTFRELSIPNDTFAYLYFTYLPTTHQVSIVPEFSSFFWLITLGSLAFIMWRLWIKNHQEFDKEYGFKNQ